MSKELDFLLCRRLNGSLGEYNMEVQGQPTGRWMIDGREELLIEVTFTRRHILPIKKRTITDWLLRRPKPVRDYEIRTHIEFIRSDRITIYYKPVIFECSQRD